MTTKEAIKEIETCSHFAATGSIRAEAEAVLLAEIESLRGALKDAVDCLKCDLSDAEGDDVETIQQTLERWEAIIERTK